MQLKIRPVRCNNKKTSEVRKKTTNCPQVDFFLLFAQHAPFAVARSVASFAGPTFAWKLSHFFFVEEIGLLSVLVLIRASVFILPFDAKVCSSKS